MTRRTGSGLWSRSGRALVRGGRALPRLIVVLLVGTAVVGALAAALPGFDVGNAGNALLVAAVVGVLNTVVWPLLMRFALAITVLTLGTGAFVLNGVLVWLVLRDIPGVRLDEVRWGVLVAFVVSGATAIASSVVALDEDEFFHRRALRRARRRTAHRTDVPGMVFVQIDGLGHDVLLRAIRDGNTPTLARWLGDGSHRLAAWETDWSSQTGASQAGLLHGSNFDIPGFRWYEKDTGRLLVCSRPADAAEIEHRLSDGQGLLHADGASRGNLFSGDAGNKSTVLSSALRRQGRLGDGYDGYFANPYSAARTVVGVVVDIVRELVAAATQRRRDVRPRVPRGGLYPFARAFGVIVTRDLVVEAILDDMMAGRSVVYADFVGYDEVAHHSGIERYDSLAVLRSIDQQIGRLARVAELAPRPYRLVVLSDHGQSQGATFEQRYGDSLAQVVAGAANPVVAGAASPVVADAAGESPADGAVARALRRMTPSAEHVPALATEEGRAVEAGTAAHPGVLVLGSGNLGLVYLTDRPERYTLEEIQAAHPDLLPTLVDHPGVGFLLVRTADKGPLVLGRHGGHYLDDGEITGADPLLGFGPHAPAQVKRTDGFPHVADIMVNSRYDPPTGEVAAFEPLVGSHGGLGGPQTGAFLLHPAEFAVPAEPLLGAERVHQVLRGWLAELGHEAFQDREQETAPAVPVDAG